MKIKSWKIMINRSRGLSAEEININALARFWKKVQLDKTNNCWLWTACTNIDGYGIVQINGIAMRAHRVMYAIAIGVVPDDLLVMHKCDVRRCCNPDHLLLGTDADNMIDASQKGRTAIGDRNGSRLHPESRERGDNHWTRRAKITMRHDHDHG